MSLRFLTQLIVALTFSYLNTTYASPPRDLKDIHEMGGLTFLKVRGYAPDTLPLSFFEELAEHGKTVRDNITYSTTDRFAIKNTLPKNLLISDGIFGERAKLEIKCSTTIPRIDSTDPSKLILKYTYKGRWGSGEQPFSFHAHLKDSDDEIFVQQWAKTLQGLEIYYQEDETLIATFSIEEENGEEVDSPSFLEKVTKAVKFVAPYVINDVTQSLAPCILPPEVLVGVNTLSAKSGFDTPLHALLPQDSSQEAEVDPLDQKRKELTKTSEAIGAALALVPGATKIRTAVNLVYQYLGYDSATHWWHGVPSKMEEDTPEKTSYQQKINLAKGAARLAIVIFVPGGKFVVIGSKIYEFIAGKSLTQTIVDKVTNASPQEEKN
ncbi:MAG: hypothetical protein J0H12_04410 [Candidatus Paracaedimonas acanthamoebae]|uniref:Uncharacterized protein n=1 Tax=Candidatus Paracaedimonas acanthamoebae TaxID=244581 RepID=A0A8J7Q109_9PROT|nr:hypothetical protein [Candidatus Paracaedimonas acanthamoebae]